MGVRIYAYAVDIAQLDLFLDMTVGELLLRYSRDGIDPNERLTFTAACNCATFTTAPNSAVRTFIEDNSGKLKDAIILAESDLEKFPILQQSAREHLSKGSTHESDRLFWAFSNCRGVDFVKRLINGDRRWWIGSVLQGAQTVLDSKDYTTLEHLFRQILRGYDCGYPISAGDIGFIKEGLPFTPDNDPCGFGRWTDDDAVSIQLLSKMLILSPVFRRPPGPIGIAPDDSEWHDWVHQNVLSLLKVRDLDYEVCNVLTFIS